MCYKTNSKDAQILLMREIPQFGKTTCLQITKLAYNINFISHPCVQECLNKIWYNKLIVDRKLYLNVGLNFLK